ncbi:unnamed protein product [Caretta caretta]
MNRNTGRDPGKRTLETTGQLRTPFRTVFPLRLEASSHARLKYAVYLIGFPLADLMLHCIQMGIHDAIHPDLSVDPAALELVAGKHSRMLLSYSRHIGFSLELFDVLRCFEGCDSVRHLSYPILITVCCLEELAIGKIHNDP